MKKITALMLFFCLLFPVACVTAETIVPAKATEATYDFLAASGNHTYRAQKDSKWGVIDAEENIIVPFSKDFIEEEADGRILFLSGTEYGYLSPDGSLSILPNYPLARSFSEGLAAVFQDGTWGFIDLRGNTVITPQYEEVGSFSGGLAWVKKDGLYGYINKNGETVVDFRYAEAYDFCEGLACVLIDDRYGYINTDGTLTILATYSVATDFSEGLAAVCKNGKWGYINLRGTTAIDFRFTHAAPFSDGQAFVKNNKLCGIIDPNGTLVFPLKFEEIGSKNASVYPVKTGGKWGYADPSGMLCIPSNFDAAKPFVNDVAAVCLGELWALITTDGAQLTDFIYKDLELLENGSIIYRNQEGFYGLMSAPEKERPTVSHPAEEKSYIRLQIGTAEIDICGETQTLPAAPMLENDRTLLPIRAVAEALGASVDWDGKTQKISICKKDKEMILKLSDSRALVNGVYYPLDVAPFLFGDTTMVPLRFVTQTLGVIPEWRGETKEIYLYY